MTSQYFASSNPVGNIIDTAARAYGLGKMIRRGPEMEAREDEEYQSGKKARATQQEIADMQLTRSRKQEGFEDATRELNGLLNAHKAHQLNLQDPATLQRLYKAGIRANVDLSKLGTEETDQHIGTLANAVANRDYKDPAALESLTAINPLLQAGSAPGETKSFRALVPSKSGGFHADLNITDADGKTRTAPLTDRRSADERDPVTHIPLDGLVSHIAATHELNEHFKDDPDYQQLGQALQSVPGDEKNDWLGQALEEHLATARGEKYDPEAEALAKRSARAKVARDEQSVETEKARAKHWNEGGRRPTLYEDAQDLMESDPENYPTMADAMAAVKYGRRGAGEPQRAGGSRASGKREKNPAAVYRNQSLKRAYDNDLKHHGKPTPPAYEDEYAPEPAKATPAPAAASATAAPAASAVPPVDMLRDGSITKFKNGQRWTLKNGQPVQVQ